MRIIPRLAFHVIYRFKTPWDIGRPQPAIVELADRGEIIGSVLDVGCGTGDSALYLAGRGHETHGIDLVPLAIRKAMKKAQRANIRVEFLVHDVLQLGELNLRFDTIIDSALFHVLSDGDRIRYARSLETSLKPGGTFFMLCFSDRQTGVIGPRRISREEIISTFGRGWRVNYIKETCYEALFPRGLSKAWLASLCLEETMPRSAGDNLCEKGVRCALR